MSSSLLEILALMEQVIKEREDPEKWRSVISGDAFEPSEDQEKNASDFFDLLSRQTEPTNKLTPEDYVVLSNKTTGRNQEIQSLGTIMKNLKGVNLKDEVRTNLKNSGLASKISSFSNYNAFDPDNIDKNYSGVYATQAALKSKNHQSPQPANFITPIDILNQDDLDKFVNDAKEPRTSASTTINQFQNIIDSYKVFPDGGAKVNYFEAIQNALKEILSFYLYNLENKTRWYKDNTPYAQTLVKGFLKIMSASEKAEFTGIAQKYNKFLEDYISTSEEEMEAGASSITRPQIQTTRKSEKLQDFSSLMDTFFQGANDLNSRVNKLEELAKFFASENLADEASKMSNTKFMSYVVMMDYLVEIVKSFDAQSGRYLLEYLLANVVMGEVVGATLGDQGQQDAVDFVGQGGEEYGSAKFISNYETGRATQSIAGFSKYEGKPITYVVAVKSGSPIRIDTKAPEPIDVQQLRVHVFPVIYKGIIKGKHKFVINGKEVPLGIKTTSIDIGTYAAEQPSYVIPLAFTTEEGTKTYRQMLQTSLGDTKKQLLAIVKDLFDELKKADEMSRKYVVTGKPDDGEVALQSIENSQTKLKSLGDQKGYILPVKPQEKSLDK